jgi:hypothetical protein
MKNEHTPSNVFPSLGESDEDFQKRIRVLGITDADRPRNAGNYNNF